MSRIIVKNLPSSGVTDEELKQHFNDIDTVTDVKLKFNEFGAFRRFAFVGFKSEEAASRAIDKLNNSFLKNNKLVIEACKAIREIKPDRLEKQIRDDGSDTDKRDRDNTPGNARKSKKRDTKAEADAFDEYRDDPEFQEFLDLQRNVGEKSQFKQVWADDIKMDTENQTSNSNRISGDDCNESVNDIEEDSGKPRKRHKRSRGKKKSTKTKPKELFVHTVKITGFPQDARRKDIKDFFKPLELLSVRINKRDGICFASFKDDSDLRFGLRKNLQFWKTSRIKIMKHDVKRSRVFKEAAREKVKDKEEKFKKYEASLADTEPIEESGRLFVRNLNYTCTQDDLEKIFSDYGQISELHFPIDKNTSMTKGYAYVEFMFPQDAARAYRELNGTIFQGRNFHLIPSKARPEPKFLTGANAGSAGTWQPGGQLSSFKKEKFAQQKESAPRAKNWNILFLGQNALADVVSQARGVDKSRLLTQQTQQEPIAVRMALGDTVAVDEMRKFLISNGIELDSFDNPQAPRSRTVIIVKNLPSQTTKADLTTLFEAHGKVARVILPPNGLSAIVEMEEPVEAKLAFKRLAYSKFKGNNVLYLEWAPINVFREKSLDDQEASELKELEKSQTGTKILVKNIPFEATLQELKKIFANFGKLNFVRIPKKIDGQHRGFGFVDYLIREDAMRAFRSVSHSTHLYGRKLVLEWAKAGNSDEQQKRPSGNDSIGQGGNSDVKQEIEV